MLDKRKAKRQTPRHRQYLEGFKEVPLFWALTSDVKFGRFSVRGSTLTEPGVFV